MVIDRAGEGPGHRPAGSTVVSDPRLAEAVRCLVDTFQPEQVYLFGSRARGDNREDSDYDLMVVVSDSDLPPHRRAQFAHHALQGVGIPKDVLVWTRAEFDRFVTVTASLPATIVREGRLLYDA